jgi:hypothetical protein
MKAIIILFLISLLWAAIASGPLVWDGSFYLFSILDSQDFFCPHDRMSNVIIQFPVLIASHYFTENLAVLRFIFSLQYALIPFLSLLISWIVVRRTPRLFIWPALGICIATIPGQFIFVSEIVIALQLAWPVLLILIVPPQGNASWIAALLLSLTIFFLHPVAVFILASLAFAGLVAGIINAENRRKSWIFASGLSILSIGKILNILLKSSSYEQNVLNFSGIIRYFGMVQPLHLFFIYLSLFLAFIILPLMHLTKRFLLFTFQGLAALLFFYDIIITARIIDAMLSGMHIHFLIVIGTLVFDTICIVILIRSARIADWLSGLKSLTYYSAKIISPFAIFIGSVLLFYVLDSHRWKWGIAYRGHALLSSLPFMLLAVVDGLSKDIQFDLSRERTKLIKIIGCIFSIVIIAQSTVWLDLIQRLRSELLTSRNQCISTESIKWLKDTPMDFWSTPSLAITLQGRHPKTLLLHGNNCQKFMDSGQVLVEPLKRRHSNKIQWFDLNLPRDLLTKHD